jgi:hypothetical protein
MMPDEEDDLGPIGVRRVSEVSGTIPLPVDEPEAESAEEAEELHDGWQPVRPRRSSIPPEG